MAMQTQTDPLRWWLSPLVWAVACWIVGTAAGRSGVIDSVVAVTLVILGGVSIAIGWRRGARWLTLGAAVALVGAAALWWDVRVGPGETEASAIRIEPESRLVRIEGVVTGDIYIQQQPSGAMGRFDYRSPKTLFLVRIEREIGDDAVRTLAWGRRTVIVDSPSYDGRLRAGDRVEVTGWLSGPRRPTNIGERDHAVWMHDRGIAGRVTLKTRGNCRLIGIAEGHDPPADWHDELVRGASWALWYGSDEPAGDEHSSADEARALLAAVLLGDGRGAMGELDESFRNTGLGHLLAISGLHLGILAAGVWLLVAILTGRPSWAAAVTLAVIVLYLLIVPPRVPILRAGLMTAVACAALTWGRRTGAISALAIAAWALIVWRPGDVFTAGFQLSFVVVTALILYADRVGRWVHDPLDPDAHGVYATVPQRALRWGADYLGVTIVAWCFATPLAAYHFGRVTPIALPMSAAILPLVAVLLWSGYAKIVLTAIWPAAGAALMPFVQALADATAWVVHKAASVPGGGWAVPEPPGLWVIAMLAWMAALFGGAFARRRLLAAALLVGAGAWLYAPAIRAAIVPDPDAMRITMFAVGDGSAYLIESGGQRMMFDCGSSQHLDITTAAVGPALRAMGVRTVPTLVLSHADLDHFSGAIELMDGFGVERLVITEAFMAEATDAPAHWREGDKPWSAAAAIVHHAEARGVDIVIAAKGWTDTLGAARIETLWPRAGDDDESNNGSLVMRFTIADRRVLMSGDVQEDAMAQMLADDTLDLRADVLELPHHGSMVDSAPAWVERVDPSIVLQSSGRARLRKDKWAGLLDGRSRHVTAWHGMTRVTIGPDGSLETARFSEKSGL